MADIFISYSREDQSQVIPVVEQLRRSGFKIWIDTEGIHGAKLWSQEIVTAIESSKVLILFASSKAFLSKNVTKEVALASEYEKHILPVFLDNAQIPTAMKYQLAGIQHLVHEKGQNSKTVNKILHTLESLDINTGTETKGQNTEQISSPKKSFTPLALATISIILFGVIGIYFLNSKSLTGHPNHKSTIDLCVITVSESEDTEKVLNANRSFRDELINKLTRFSEYKVTKGSTLTRDATSLDYAGLSEKLRTDFIVQISSESDGDEVIAQLFDGKEGRSLWSKSIKQVDVSESLQFEDESTGIIAGNLAGYDGAIHREILKKALIKNEKDLTPIEMLQIGKAAWEDMTKDNITRAIQYLERCVELNPDITTAYAVLCEIYVECLRREYSGVADPLIRAKEASQKALQLDPNNAIALIETFWMLWYQKDYSGCDTYIKLAMEANPYEPYVCISAGSFKVVRDIDVENGLALSRLAMKYSEQPQGWYVWPWVIHYSRIGEYEKSLEHAISGNFKDDNNIAQTAVLYWLTNQKKTALSKYKEIKEMNPDYSPSEYKRFFIEIFDNKGIDNHLDVLKEIETAYSQKINP